MQIDNTLVPENLIHILSQILTPEGFWRFPHMDYFVRTRHGIRDVIGWERNIQTNRYAIYFGVWVPELEQGLSSKQVDESSDIQNKVLMHDLSLAGKNGAYSYWWEESQQNPLSSFLRRQVQYIGLPYFDTFAGIGDVAEMVFYDQRFHNTDIEGRLLSNASSSFFSYDQELASEQVATALKFLNKEVPAFQYSGGYYWRRNQNSVFHIILPEFFAAWRFVQIKVAVWHPAIDALDTVPENLPTLFSQVAWQSFAIDGSSAEGYPPAFLGESSHRLGSLEEVVESLKNHGLPWLYKIQSEHDVFEAIRDEYKKFYP